MAISYDYVKISYRDLTELQEAVEKLNARRIIRIESCIPEATDTRYWIGIYYEYFI
jgi:hypothetical protein